MNNTKELLNIKELLNNNLDKTLFNIKGQLKCMLDATDRGCTVCFTDLNDFEYFGYENQAYAAISALLSCAKFKDKTTIAELISRDLVFGVAIIEHKDSIFYDLNCYGIGCSLFDIFDAGLSWYENEWKMIKAPSFFTVH